MFSFRLDPNNPREIRALDVIRSRQKDGFSVRDVIAEALLIMGDESMASYGKQLDEVSERLNELINLICFRTKNVLVDRSEEGNQRDSTKALAGNFLGAVKMAARPGLRWNE